MTFVIKASKNAGPGSVVCMEPETVCIPSAFKHGISESDIRWVLTNHLADGIIEGGDETKYLSIGFDKKGILLEIMYNRIDERTIKVFHAMKCRKRFYEKLKEEGLWRT